MTKKQIDKVAYAIRFLRHELLETNVCRKDIAAHLYDKLKVICSKSTAFDWSDFRNRALEKEEKE